MFRAFVVYASCWKLQTSISVVKIPRQTTPSVFGAVDDFPRHYRDDTLGNCSAVINIPFDFSATQRFFCIEARGVGFLRTDRCFDRRRLSCLKELVSGHLPQDICPLSWVKGLCKVRVMYGGSRQMSAILTFGYGRGGKCPVFQRVNGLMAGGTSKVIFQSVSTMCSHRRRCWKATGD